MCIFHIFLYVRYLGWRLFRSFVVYILPKILLDVYLQRQETSFRDVAGVKEKRRVPKVKGVPEVKGHLISWILYGCVVFNFTTRRHALFLLPTALRLQCTSIRCLVSSWQTECHGYPSTSQEHTTFASVYQVSRGCKKMTLLMA